MALLANCQDALDLAGVRAFLSVAIVYPIVASISRRALRILDQLAPPSGLTADDALVAATALAHKLPLYTLDPARFAAVPGLSALPPY
jgi:predicted nucleic acid-binding protein